MLFGIKGLREIDYEKTVKDIEKLVNIAERRWEAEKKVLEIGPGNNYFFVKRLLEGGYEVAVIDKALPGGKISCEAPTLAFNPYYSDVFFFHGDFKRLDPSYLHETFGSPAVTFSIGTFGRWPGLSTVPDNWDIINDKGRVKGADTSDLAQKLDKLGSVFILFISPRYCQAFEENGEMRLYSLLEERSGQKTLMRKMKKLGWKVKLVTSRVGEEELEELIKSKHPHSSEEDVKEAVEHGMKKLEGKVINAMLFHKFGEKIKTLDLILKR